MSQTERILFIDRKIRSKGKITAAECAEHFEVTVRQIKRDIEYLRCRFNAPLVYSRLENGYLYDAEFNKLAFADQHLLFFYLVSESLTRDSWYIPVVSEELIEDIKKKIPADYRSVSSKISFQLPQIDVMQPDFFMDFCDSIREKKALEIVYSNLNGYITHRNVEPEQLINYSGSWYAVCFDQMHQELRTFLFSRIQNVKKTKIPFTNHSTVFPNSEFLSYEEYLNAHISNAYGIFKGEKTYPAKIRVSGKAARIVKTQIWHQEQKVSETAEYTELTFPVANFTELVSKLLSLGHEAVPIEPEQLCSQWKDEIRKLASLC